MSTALKQEIHGGGRTANTDPVTSGPSSKDPKASQTAADQNSVLKRWLDGDEPPRARPAVSSTYAKAEPWPRIMIAKRSFQNRNNDAN